MENKTEQNDTGEKMDGREQKSSLRCRDAADERQYMLSGDYEVYEKVGEPVGAVSFHYHDFMS